MRFERKLNSLLVKLENWEIELRNDDPSDIENVWRIVKDYIKDYSSISTLIIRELGAGSLNDFTSSENYLKDLLILRELIPANKLTPETSAKLRIQLLICLSRTHSLIEEAINKNT